LALVRIEDLSIAFGGLTALSGVSLAVEPGEVFALIGPNGAGKTTVFNVLTGLYRPTAGRVILDGADLTRLTPHEIARRGVGRTFQNTEVFRALSALDNVLVGEHARLRGGLLAAALALPAVRREEAAARARALALLARVGLGDVAAVEAGSLPLGSQKRLEMARALAARPRLLLLDEPAGGLNPTETRTLMDLIVRLREELALTIMVVEHDMELVMAISDRVAVLDHGRLIAQGPPAVVAADPAVIEAYLGSGGPDMAPTPPDAPTAPAEP
jgi:branched-chain amino acid transport system ATP-binding protein